MIRGASLGDIQKILALWDAAYEAGSSRSSAQDVPALLSHGPSARLLVAEDDGRIVGTLIAAFDGWRGNVYRLAVQPDCQRRGIAKQLVEVAQEWLRTLGCVRITALVEGDPDYATGFWESVGYTHDPRMRRYHLDIGKHEP